VVGLPARLNDQLAELRHRFRPLLDALSAWGLWVLIGALFVWAALDERQLFVVGIVVGSIYALGALGLTLIYGILKFGNFAHGDTMMLGAYVAYFVLTGRIVGERTDTNTGLGLDRLPAATDRLGDLTFGYAFLLAVAAAVIVIALVSVGLDRVIYRPLRRRGSSIVIFAIASLGVALATRSVILFVWGPDSRVYVSGIHRARHLPFDIVLKTDQIFVLIVAVALTAAMYLLLFRTKLGKAMRATADNPALARVAGINTEQTIVWTWIIGGALVAVAGVLLALQANLTPNLGFFLLLPLFAAAILGGLGNPVGALLGAMVVGVAQETSVEFLSPGYKASVAFFILVVILLLRPHGLFGGRTR